ncbi:MCE family protein [Rhodococcus erythropolis]|uniref:MCE family protein n=1 Tax=Rhodococcus erythropolis TaxID=1833 RepID=UPI00294A57E5|nr:MCE family protein [Rhodococcus erythropolis]MDV6272138.1 MCE family protein [Rhodococcus erythropolis]
MDRLTTRTKIVYALRGAIAVVVAVVAAVTMVLRGSGNLEQSTDVFVAVPATAGLISGEAPVRYHGVNIGRIGEIESGTTESVVQLQIQTEDASKIPSDVVARVVPRTFFGDIYMQLVDNPAPQGQTTLADGDEIRMDDGPEAVALYDVYTKLVGVLTAMQPEKLQTALTALGQALDGNGAEIGTTIDNLSAASGVLAPAAHQFLQSTPEFRSVIDALDRATPDILDTLAAATSVSNSMVANRANLETSIGAAAVFAATVDDFVATNNSNIITVIDSAGKILATTAANPEGLRSTLANASTFGASGARVFATGKFDITAVATFAEPLPYTGADCPQYGDSRGAQCSGSNLMPAQPVSTPVVGGEAEAATLRYLEDQLLGGSPKQSDAPNPATTLMLGPMVRGNEVTVP